MTRARRSLGQRLARFALLLLPLSPSGCFFLCTINEEDSTLKYDADLLNQSMQQLLRPGACALRPFEPAPEGEPNLVLRYFGRDGAALGYVGGRLGFTLHVNAQGELVAADGPTTYPERASAVPTSAGFLAYTCNAGSALLAHLLQATPLRAHSFPLAGCDAVVGPGAAPDQAVLAARQGDVVTLSRVDTELALTGAVTTNIAGGRVRFADEQKAGVYAVVVQLDTTTWLYRELPAGAAAVEHTASLPADLDEGDRVRREASGALLVAAGDSAVRWHVESDGSLENVATSGPPDIGDGKWLPEQWFGGATAIESVPNEEEPSLRVPIAYRSRALTTGGFTVEKPATTPCRSADFCRNVGESTLVGVIGHGGKAWGVYDVWAWAEVESKSLRAVYAAPLFESSDAANALGCEGLELDGGVEAGNGGTGGTGGGTGGISDGGPDADAEPDVSTGGVAGSAGGAAGTGGSTGGTGGSTGGTGGSTGGTGGSTGGTGGSTGGSGGSSGGTGGASCDAGAPLSGSASLVGTVTGGTVSGLAVDSTHVYAADYGSKLIRRIPLPSGTVETLYADTGLPNGVALGGTEVYWTTEGGDVKRAPKSGGSAILIANVGAGAGPIAVDGTYAYVARDTTAPVARVTIATGAIQPLASLTSAAGMTLLGSGDLVVSHIDKSELTLVPVSGAASSVFVQLGAGRQGYDVAREGQTLFVGSISSTEILGVDETCKAVWVANAGNQPRALAVSPTHVYFASWLGSQVYSILR